MSTCPDSVATALDVSRETLDCLEQFVDLVEKWSTAINLVSRGSLPHIWQRHVLDSAQLAILRPPNAARWLDLGAGGGFPGIVLACMARETDPDLAFTLIESDQRKAEFLRTCARTLDLNVTVLAQRVESLPPKGADVVSARALAPLSDLLSYTEPHLAPSGIALFPKGAAHAEELVRARRNWHFRCAEIPSKTDPEGVVLKIGGIARA